MTTFGPIKKRPPVDANNLVTNIIGQNPLGSPPIASQTEAISRIYCVFRKNCIDSLDVLINNTNCDNYFNLPENTIEYLSNHVDTTRRNFREYRIINNFLSNIETYNVKLKENALDQLNNISYFVVEHKSCNWDDIPSDNLFSSTVSPESTETEYNNIIILEKKQIKVFKVDCNSLLVTDITTQILEPVDASELDSDLVSIDCEMISDIFTCDTLDYNIELPDFLPDPSIIVNQNGLKNLLPPYNINIYIDLIDIATNNKIYLNQPLYSDGPRAIDLQSILTKGISCTIDSASFYENNDPSSVSISGKTDIRGGGSISVSATLTTNSANGIVSIKSSNQEILQISYVNNLNESTSQATLSFQNSSGSLSSLYDSASSKMNINQDLNNQKKIILKNIAEKYVSKYRIKLETIDEINNLVTFNIDGKDKSRVKGVLQSLSNDKQISTVSSDGFVSFSSSVIKPGIFGEPASRQGGGLTLETTALSTKTFNSSNGIYLWHLDRINQRLSDPMDTSISNYINGGENAVVYVFDTGVEITHQEFEGRAVYGYSAFGSTAIDRHGHGTHVAGTIAGKNVGVAKKATIVAVKILDDRGYGSYWGIIEGIKWTIEDIKRRKAIDPNKYFLANFSLGGPAFLQVDKYVDELSNHCEIFVAAGNARSFANQFSPARAHGVYAIGATALTTFQNTKYDNIAWFTNYGQKVVMHAPGVDIFSSIINNKYAYFSGTSMASPLACGAFAIDPSIFNNQTEDSINCIVLLDNNLPIFERRRRYDNQSAMCSILRSLYNNYTSPVPPEYPFQGNTSDDMPRGLFRNELLYTNIVTEQERQEFTNLDYYPPWPKPETLGSGNTANFMKQFDWDEQECSRGPSNVTDGLICGALNSWFGDNRRWLSSGRSCEHIVYGNSTVLCDAANFSTVGTNGAASNYGTFDQNGNTSEYVERETTEVILLNRIDILLNSLVLDINTYAIKVAPFTLEPGNQEINLFKSRIDITDLDGNPILYTDMLYNNGLFPVFMFNSNKFPAYGYDHGRFIALKSNIDNALHIWDFNSDWKLLRKRVIPFNNNTNSTFMKIIRGFENVTNQDGVPTQGTGVSVIRFSSRLWNNLKPIDLADINLANKWIGGTPVISIVGGGTNSYGLTSSETIPAVEGGGGITLKDNRFNINNFWPLDTSFRIVSKNNIHNYSNFINVDDIGNNPNPVSGFGKVDYTYKIGKYIITTDEYVEFLNAVDADSVESKIRGYFNWGMMYGEEVVQPFSSTQTPLLRKMNIIYVDPEAGQRKGRFVSNDNYGNKPISKVPFLAALRYCNWLQNGKPNPGFNYTESGSYDIVLSDFDKEAIARIGYLTYVNSTLPTYHVYKNPRADYFIPTIDEWYKAAFYKGGE